MSESRNTNVSWEQESDERLANTHAPLMQKHIEQSSAAYKEVLNDKTSVIFRIEEGSFYVLDDRGNQLKRVHDPELKDHPPATAYGAKTKDDTLLLFFDRETREQLRELEHKNTEPLPCVATLSKSEKEQVQLQYQKRRR